MELTASNFFSHLIFHPFDADTTRDKLIAVIASVACAIFSVGTCHLICAFRNYCFSEKSIHHIPHDSPAIPVGASHGQEPNSSDTPSCSGSGGPAGIADDSQSQDFSAQVIAWREEAKGSEEYKDRITATSKILHCYSSGETRLDLHGAKLTSLPPLNLPNLERLDLSLNRLTSLPECLNLPNLELLNLACNQLTSLPEQLNLPNLQHLSLTGNRLGSLPEQLNLPNLEQLCLEGNGFASLPEHLNLPKLKALKLSGNNLAFLPAFNLPNLEILHLSFNRNLQELPLSLATSNLLFIDYADTQIPPEMVNNILAACRSRRNAEASKTLPELLNLWSAYAKKEAQELQFILQLPEEDKPEEICEWLIRLAKTQDFKNNQRTLAEIVCEMLADLSNEGFKEHFLTQIAENNTGCDDRAAMGLNELYVAWKILIPKEKTLADHVKLLAEAGKTLALRKILSAIPQMAEQAESVEIYLYYESILQKRLGLLTAIQTMHYARVGKRDWIDENQLIEQVQEQYLDETIDIPIFSRLFSQDPNVTQELYKLREFYDQQLEQVEADSEQNKLTSQAYHEACQTCMLEQAKAERKLKKTWLLKLVNS